MYFGLYDTLKPMLLGADAGVGASFLLGWAVTITAGLLSYPIGKFLVRDNEISETKCSTIKKISLHCRICKPVNIFLF